MTTTDDSDKRLHPDPIVRCAYYVKRTEAAEIKLAVLRAGIESLAARWEEDSRSTADLNSAGSEMRRCARQPRKLLGGET